MEAVKKLQEALSLNYYNSFLISLESYDEIDFEIDFVPVKYKDVNYIERNIFTIRKEGKKITNNIKPLYQNAIGEIYLKLSNLTNNEDKLSYLSNTIQFFNIPMYQLKKDYFIDNKESRFYSEIDEGKEVVSFEEIINKFLKLTSNHKTYGESLNGKFNYDGWDFLYFNLRSKVLGFLPLSLFIICNSFIKVLQNNIDKIAADNNENSNNLSDLNWNGSTSQLGFLLGTLASLDYLNAPLKKDGEINNKQFARELNKVFNTNYNVDSLARYISISTDKAEETKRRFENKGFNIPHIKEVSS